MKKNLLLEVERNLTLMGISKKVNLINEGRGEFSKRIWGLILQVGDETASGVQKRSTNLTKMLNNTGTSLLETRKRALKAEIERMVREGSSVDEIIEYLERELTPEVMETLEKKISSLQLIDDVVRRSLYDELSNTNSLLRSEVLEDAEQEIARFVSEPKFIDLNYTNRINALNDFKNQLATMYGRYFDIASDSKILNDILEEPIERTKIEVETTGKIKTLDQQTNDAIKDLKNSDKWLGDLEKGISVPTRLQKIKMLNDLLAQLKDNATKKLGILSDNVKIKKGIDDLIEIEVKAVEAEVASLKNVLKTGWKNFAPRLSDFAMRVTTSLQGNLDKAKQEIDDLIVAMGSTDDIGPELAKTIRSKYAALVTFMKAPDIKTYWGELSNLIKDAYGQDEGASIIRMITEEGEEKDWMTFLLKEAEQGTESQLAGYMGRMIHMLTGWWRYFSSLSRGIKDMPSFDKTWWKRVLNWGLTGHTRTLRELMDSFIKAQYGVPFLKIGKIKGYNYQSLFFKYIQLWIYAKVVPTVIYSIIYGILAGAMGRISQPSEEEIKNFTPEEKEAYESSKNIMSLIWYTFKEGFSENFDLFMSSNEDVKKAVEEAKKNGGVVTTEWKWYLREFFDTFIPVEPMIAEILEWADKGLKTPFEKTWEQRTKDKEEEIKEDLNKDLENVKEKFRDKLDDIDKSHEQKKFETNYSNSYHGLTQEEVDMLTKWTSSRDASDGSTEVWVDDRYSDDKYFLTAGTKENGGSPKYAYWNDNGKLRSLKELAQKLSQEPVKESIIKKIKNILMEDSGKKFGDDNFKHWKDTFTFKSVDEKNPGQYKEVKINMEDVMDRINHYRKKYDEDDAFVRAVIDTHEDVVKVMFTKDLANLQENFKPKGLAIILQQIRESRGEMEIWSVSRPANGNWFLVKGDYTPNQLANMDLEKKEPQPKEKEVDSRTEDDLKKKEELALHNLKSNEKEGIEDLPKQVRDKVKEKLSKGWTTEEPFFAFEEFYEVSEINSVFNDKIKIYKLDPSEEFFKVLVDESASVRVSRGFCKSLNQVKNQSGLVERQQKVLNHFIQKCENKFGNEPIKKYRQARFND